jgi:predicted nucleic acid-binding protein
MNAIGVVVADTTPLNYLIIIGRAEILTSLFGEVLIPQAVLEELSHPKAPETVCRWLQEPPSWLRISPVEHLDETIQLGKGENEAISLAIERRVKVVLMDERLGREAAEARGLIPLGTLNLIDLADEQGLLDGIATLNDLRQTTFRAAPELVGRFEARMKARQD